MRKAIRLPGDPVWLFRQLSQGRFILRLFLIGLLLIFFIGFAGVLQSELSAIGAGQTELAYSMASLRNAASLLPIEGEGPYSSATTPDAELQRYFALDKHQGVLVLRDGLRSLSFQTNPLSSFPLQIEKAAQPGMKPQVVSLYIQLLDCNSFLALLPGHSQTLSEADRVLRCMQVPPVIKRPSTLKQVKEWIESKSMGLLPTQREAYLSDADLILSKQLKNGPTKEWAKESATVVSGESPVWQIFLLKDRATPGMQIFPAADLPFASRASPTERSAGVRESREGVVFRTLDRGFLAILQLRYPVLIALGLLVPLLALIMRQRDVVVRRCLEPYLLLLLAQVITLVVADALMGEGLMIWVGLFYTLLRLMQLVGLMWMSQASDQRLRRLFELKSRSWLLTLLRLELVLWSINALGLGWHIFGVLREFPFISPA